MIKGGCFLEPGVFLDASAQRLAVHADHAPAYQSRFIGSAGPQGLAKGVQRALSVRGFSHLSSECSKDFGDRYTVGFMTTWMSFAWINRASVLVRMMSAYWRCSAESSVSMSNVGVFAKTLMVNSVTLPLVKILLTR